MSEENPPKRSWLKLEITYGFERMIKARMHYVPNDRLAIDETIDEWVDVIWPGCRWDELRDTPRIRGAFQSILRECPNFPSPQEFLQKLKNEPFTTLQLPKPTGVSKEEAKIWLKKIRKKQAEIIGKGI